MLKYEKQICGYSLSHESVVSVLLVDLSHPHGAVEWNGGGGGGDKDDAACGMTSAQVAVSFFCPRWTGEKEDS